MTIPSMAPLQQHDAPRDILTEPAAWRRSAIEARGHSEFGEQSGRKNQPACRSVHLSVTLVSPAKMAAPIEMPFGLRTRAGPWNHVLDGGPDLHGKGQF